jgi:hypothetical protein
MKDFIYAVLEPILLEHLPEHIAEIGTHKANTASQMIKTLAPKVKKLHYTGYDIFDFAIDNVEFNKSEGNGKNGAALEHSKGVMRKMSKRFDNFTYDLNQGFTTDTLVEPRIFDFVYIDGGHSYDTVKHDYSMVKDSKVIVFDDLNLSPVLKFVNELIEQGVDIKTVTTPSKHIWGLIVNK